MKKNMLILAVPFFTVLAYSQNSTQNKYEEWKHSQDEYTSFDIGKYKTPDIVRNQLDIDFRFNSSSLRSDYFLTDREDRNEATNTIGYLMSSFSRYVNTRKQISNFTGYLSFGGNYNAQDNKETFLQPKTTINNNVSALGLQNSLLLSWLNKWYFSRLIFMDYGMNGNIGYDFGQTKTKNQLEDSDLKQKEFLLNISPQLGIGYGRIENVRDARHAVYVANALTKRKVLTRNLSDDELVELSQHISTIKNKRFLDSRLHLIDEISTVDSFLVNNNLLADNGATYIIFHPISA